jgi:hypothetical protein
MSSLRKIMNEPHFARLSHTCIETEEGDPRHASYHSIVTFQSSTLLRCNNALSPCAKEGLWPGLKVTPLSSCRNVPYLVPPSEAINLK